MYQSYENKFYLSTTDSSILVYEVIEDPFSINLILTRKKLFSKPVEKMLVVSILDTILVLADDLVHLLDLYTFDLHNTIVKTKGATSIALWPPLQSMHSEEPIKKPSVLPNAKFCVVIKKKLMFFIVSPSATTEVSSLNLNGTIKDVLWIVHVDSGATQEVFSTNFSVMPSLSFKVPKNLPIMCLIEDHSITFLDLCFCMSLDNYSIRDKPIEWSEIPISVCYYSPYVVANLPTKFEVRSFRTQALVQTFQLPHAFRMVPGDIITVASPNSVWRLLPLDFEDQIEQLIEMNKFEEAEKLIEELEFPSKEDQISNIIRVKGLEAHYKFTQLHQYEEAIKTLEDLNASPLDVINLFPDLAINEDNDVSPEPVPASEKNAIIQLMHYLTDQRTKLNKFRSIKGNANTKQFEESIYLSQVIDTTLLKVYLKINDSFARSLLRIDNNCLVEECEVLLKEYKKPLLLVELYKNKGLNKMALEYLSKSIESPTREDYIVEFLKRLNSMDINLIFEYATSLMKADPEIGIKIFTENENLLDTKVRLKVFKFIESFDFKCSRIYLEKVIEENVEEDPEFTEMLIFSYIKEIRSAPPLSIIKLFKVSSVLIFAFCGILDSELTESLEKLLRLDLNSYSLTNVLDFFDKDDPGTIKKYFLANCSSFQLTRSTASCAKDNSIK
ncbi:Vam6/Vps39-like protein [Lobulomyces angularis]|nr:Vam6/Vps39-like protein [Lobulomyces angularis]